MCAKVEYPDLAATLQRRGGGTSSAPCRAGYLQLELPTLSHQRHNQREHIPSCTLCTLAYHNNSHCCFYRSPGCGRGIHRKLYRMESLCKRNMDDSRNFNTPVVTKNVLIPVKAGESVGNLFGYCDSQ